MDAENLATTGIIFLFIFHPFIRAYTCYITAVICELNGHALRVLILVGACRQLRRASESVAPLVVLEWEGVLQVQGRTVILAPKTWPGGVGSYTPCQVCQDVFVLFQTYPA
jgi:hypothetical protein